MLLGMRSSTLAPLILGGVVVALVALTRRKHATTAPDGPSTPVGLPVDPLGARAAENAMDWWDQMREADASTGAEVPRRMRARTSAWIFPPHFIDPNRRVLLKAHVVRPGSIVIPRNWPVDIVGEARVPTAQLIAAAGSLSAGNVLITVGPSPGAPLVYRIRTTDPGPGTRTGTPVEGWMRAEDLESRVTPTPPAAPPAPVLVPQSAPPASAPAPPLPQKRYGGRISSLGRAPRAQPPPLPSPVPAQPPRAGTPASRPTPTLRLGARGDAVTRLQSILRSFGFLHQRPGLDYLVVDGVFGARTERVVQTFQALFGLPITGVVDDPTWIAIYRIIGF